MTEHTLPTDDHEAEKVARRAKLYVLTTETFTGDATMESSCGAFLGSKDRYCYRTFMEAHVRVMLHQGH